MPKLHSDPISASDIDEYLATSDDFALELFVCSTARKQRLNASHSGTYVDSVTGKHRQYDVRASIEHRNRTMALAIECKALQPNCPLVVLRTPRLGKEAKHEFIYSYELNNPTSIASGFVSARSISIPSELYAAGQPAGRSTAQVGRIATDKTFATGDSGVYEKWAQALSSATDLVHDAVKAHHRSDRPATVSAVFPVLVVSNETLWAADYTDDGSRTGVPEQIDEALLYVGRDYKGPGRFAFKATHLHIYTKRGIEEFLTSVGDGGGPLWERTFPRQMIPDAALLP